LPGGTQENHESTQSGWLVFEQVCMYVNACIYIYVEAYDTKKPVILLNSIMLILRGGGGLPTVTLFESHIKQIGSHRIITVSGI